MNAAELKKLTTQELNEKERELRENIFRMRFKLATGELEDTAQMRTAKKDIARIQTILKARETEGSNGK